MTAPVNPPVSAVEATVEDLLAALSNHSPHGSLYIYIDEASAQGKGINMAAAAGTFRSSAYRHFADEKTVQPEVVYDIKPETKTTTTEVA